MKILSKIFPSPNYLNIPCFGVYMSDTSIKYVQINSNGIFDKLGKFGVVDLPEGVIRNGEILNPEKVVEILRDIKNKEKVSFARVGIDEKNIFQYILEIPVEKSKNIKQIVEASVEEKSGTSFKNFVVDYEIIEASTKSIKISVFVSKKQTIGGYISIFDKAKIKIISLEPAGNALVRAVGGGSGGQIIVDIGKRKTDLLFVYNGKKIYSTEIFFGGELVTKALVAKLGLSFSQAENKKISVGLNKSLENKDFFEFLVGNISILKDKINSTYLEWISENKEQMFLDFKLQKIILSGGTANMAGLKDYLATTLKIPVEIANPWINLQTSESFVSTMTYEDSLSFAQVVGLAMAEK
ncbi:MAG: type pilus assembly protein PilM [Bacteroidota bacterium]|nr:type pilus assembly protein PilM [Bacteroidota bacterium]